MSDAVETTDLQNRLSELLARAGQGEEIAITRNGRVVARLVPPRAETGDAAQRAKRIRARARRLGVGFDWQEWKAHRDEGRR